MILALIKAAALAQFDESHGWPETFSVDQISILQSWRKDAHLNDGGFVFSDYVRALNLAVELKNIKFTSITSRINLHNDFIHESRIYSIASIDFAAWLATQNQEPSWIIAAWFKSQGVGVKEQQTEPVPVPAIDHRIMKRSALIELHERGDWPTIKKDLSDASRNGLSAAASLGGGMWDMDDARKWAEARGKIRKAPELASWIPSVVRHIAR